MKDLEQELIKELMRLTGQGEAEAQGFLETLKKKTLGEVGMAEVSGEKKFTENDYPHNLPSDNVLKYTLRITMKNISPSIWRKVEVPSNISLRHLSELIMAVMGWSGNHMNQF